MTKKDDDQQDDKKVTADDLQDLIKEAEEIDEQEQEEMEEENVGDGHACPSNDDDIEETAKLKEALARTMADFQNFKRRAEEDKMRFVKFANADLLKELLPIIDNFDRACVHVPDELKEDVWAKGVVSTHDELMKALDKIGVKKTETVGQKFDPTKHDALMSGPGEKDVIIEELEPGYIYNDTTIKAAKVKVGDGS